LLFIKTTWQLPEIQPFIRYKPAIIAIILALFFPLQKNPTVQLGIIGCIVLLLSLLQFNETVLFGAGFLCFEFIDQQKLE
jgi:chromate transporter